MNVQNLHDDVLDYDDEPRKLIGLMDRLFIGILPIHFVFLTFVPCWWAMSPASIGWAGLGVLVCRHPLARRNATILLVISLLQLAALGFIFRDAIFQVNRI